MPRDASAPARKPARKKTVLVVDEDTALRRALAAALVPADVEVLTAATVPAALSIARTKRLDVLVVGDGLAEALAENIEPPAIVWIVSDDDGPNASTRAFAERAALSFTRDGDVAGLARNVAASLDLATRLREADALARTNEELLGMGQVVFAGRAMREAVARTNALSREGAPILFMGERGTGRATLARHLARVARLDLVEEIDAASSDATRALTEALRAGPSEAILIRDLQAMPATDQALLLRHVQSRPAAPRLLATADAELRRRHGEGAFLRELFFAFRLVELAPLRERREDVTMLARHFANRAARRAGLPPPRIGAETLRFLRGAPLSENAHDVERAMETAVALARGGSIAAAHVDPERMIATGTDEPFAEAKERVVADFEARYVREQLDRAKGNAALAARLSGLDRANFRRLVRRLDLEPKATARSKKRGKPE